MNVDLRHVMTEATGHLGHPPTKDEWSRALPRAERKLRQIISREGDADGRRREPWYLAKLVAEAVSADQYMRYTREKAAPRGDQTALKVYRPRVNHVNPAPMGKEADNEAGKFKA